jgi:hypothetical protein
MIARPPGSNRARRARSSAWIESGTETAESEHLSDPTGDQLATVLTGDQVGETLVNPVRWFSRRDTGGLRDDLDHRPERGAVAVGQAVSSEDGGASRECRHPVVIVQTCFSVTA